MNSIRRPRRRPRVDSVNFRVFEWVLLRESVLRLLWPSYEEWGGQRQARQWLAKKARNQVLAIGADFLSRYPERRYHL